MLIQPKDELKVNKLKANTVMKPKSLILLSMLLLTIPQTLKAQESDSSKPPTEQKWGHRHMFKGGQDGEQGGGGFNSHMPGDGIRNFLKELNLSDEQRKAVGDVMRENSEEMRSRMEEFRAAKEAQFAAVHQDKFDEKAIRDAIAKAASLEADFAVERAKKLEKVRAILTPEQRTKLTELKSKMKEEFAAKREKWREGKKQAFEELDN